MRLTPIDPAKNQPLFEETNQPIILPSLPRFYLGTACEAPWRTRNCLPQMRINHVGEFAEKRKSGGLRNTRSDDEEQVSCPLGAEQ